MNSVQGEPSARRKAAAARRRIALIPTRDDLVDAGFLGALGLTAMLELRVSFAGWTFLVVGALGILLGVVISHLANALRQPVLILLAMGFAAFFLLGGAVALRDNPGDSVIPTTGTLNDLAHISIHGWRDLLTTVPPVDGNGPLLVLPYMLGLFAGLSGFALARRTRGAMWPGLVVLGIFILVILLGTTSPHGVVATASVFVVMSLAWIAVRTSRQRIAASTGAGKGVRLATAAALLAVTGAGAYAIGPHLPGSHDATRLVLRKHISLPFDIGDYPSPLTKYRQYVTTELKNGQPVGLSKQTLFTISGSLPAGSPVRLATLDAYNGTSWVATNTPADGSDRPNSFLRVGPTLANPVGGPAYTMHVTVDRYDDYWLPTAGGVRAIKFTDRNAHAQTDAFRYNLSTGAGVVTSKLGHGSSYDLTVAGVTTPALRQSDILVRDGYSDTGSFLRSTATSLAGASPNVTAQVLMIGSSLKSIGRYTHGDPSSGFAYYLPGHAQGRLTDFVHGVIPGVLFVGDDEQYGAAYALMISQLGVPARVVVGVPGLRADGVVRGADIAVWIEVQTVDGSWRTIPDSMFLDRNRPPDKKQLQKPDSQPAGAQVPPPAQGRPKSSIDDAAQANAGSTSVTKKKPRTPSAAGLPAWLVAVLVYGASVLGAAVLVVGSIAGIKAVRRHRRRTAGTPSVRLAGGWREVLDHVRDLGTAFTPYATRREQANEVGSTPMSTLARFADAHIFGGDEITAEHADQFWRQVALTRQDLNSSTTRWQRWRALVNLSTFAPKFSGAAR